MLDVHRLRIFRAVVASGSVNAAAQHLGYTPSAVSQHLASLQKETGLVLFEKSGRGIVATPSARVLASESDEVMSSLARLGGVVSALRDGKTGRLSISSFASAAQSWLAPIAAELRRQYPQIVLELALNEVSEELPNRYPDLDIRSEDPGEPGRETPGYTREVLTEEGYRLAAPLGHPLLDGDDAVNLAELADYPWIDNDFHDSTCGQIVRRCCRAAGFSPQLVALADDHHTALAFVEAGVGITALPSLVFEHASSGVGSRALANPEPRRRIVAYVRDGLEAVEPVQFALAALREVASTQSVDP